MDTHPPSSSSEGGKQPRVDIAELFAKRPPGSKAAIFLRGGVQIRMRISDPEAAMKEVVPFNYAADTNIVHAYQDPLPTTGTIVYGPPFLARDGSGFCAVLIKDGRVVSKRRIVEPDEDPSATIGTPDYGEHFEIPECFARSIARLRQSSAAGAAAATTCTKDYPRTRVPSSAGYYPSVKRTSFRKGRRLFQADKGSSAASATAALGGLCLEHPCEGSAASGDN